MKYTLEKTIEQYKNDEKLNYIFFWGHKSSGDTITKSCFSQWYPCEIEEDGVIYNTAEHYMMAEKAKLFGDMETWEEIIESTDPKEAKELGRKIKNFNSKLWDEKKYSIVKQGNFLKFSQDVELGDFLINTNDTIIVESSPYDKIWGIGMLSGDPKAKNPTYWSGENLLGFALMEVRDML